MRRADSGSICSQMCSSLSRHCSRYTGSCADAIGCTCRCKPAELTTVVGTTRGIQHHNAWHTTSCATVSVAGAVRSAIRRQSKADPVPRAHSTRRRRWVYALTALTVYAHLEAEDVVDGDGQLVVELPRRARSVGYELLFAHKLRVRAVQCRCVVWAWHMECAMAVAMCQQWCGTAHPVPLCLQGIAAYHMHGIARAAAV